MSLKSIRRLSRSPLRREFPKKQKHGERGRLHLKVRTVRSIAAALPEASEVVSTWPHFVPRGSYDYPLSLLHRSAALKYSQISIDPERKSGAPCIVGTRIPVYMVLDALEEHGTIDGVRASYPTLTAEQIRHALGFAKFVLECPIDEIAPVA